VKGQHRFVGERLKTDQFERLKVHESMGETVVVNRATDKTENTIC